MSAPIRFEQGRAMQLAGLRRHHPFEQGDFGGQWRDFSALLPLPGQLGEHVFGVICAATDTHCEYLCGVEVAALEALPKTLGRMRIEPQTYAIFRHLGHVSALPQTWQSALDWLAQSDYQSAHKPDFERYGARFDAATGSGEVEIWLAVVPKQALA
ncbi:GyrI-like domain-containing protein [Aeromonas bivalvium]|uniref:GyrI-like domain-containing protein n=1 Tax=Aeromonas bivalvium TaxID=440079 RepID=A0ABW9GR02_9GAMM